MRQSLFEKPETGILSNDNTRSNSFGGYYADGFFDRRWIGSGVWMYRYSEDFALRGRLFFNPVTNASLFFPAEMYRSYSTGNFTSASASIYWTSSAGSISEAWGIRVVSLSGVGAAYMTHAYRSYGYLVRCVRQ
jgi:hypothetical protein